MKQFLRVLFATVVVLTLTDFTVLLTDAHKCVFGARISETREEGVPVVGFEYMENLKIPDNFDARNHWPCCESLRDVRDQGDCGSCVAHATAGAMTDRICIQSQGNVKFYFSSQQILSCGDKDVCTDGMNDTAGWNYYTNNGVVSGGPYDSQQGCQPLTSISTDNPICQHRCTNPRYPKPLHWDRHFGCNSMYFGTPEAAQRDIMTNGPITTSFDVYDDFSQFDAATEIYMPQNDGSTPSGHCVRIIGWGVENGVKYWFAANSWGPDWGMGGHFKFIRGTNACRFESNLRAANPDFNRYTQEISFAFD